MTNASLPRRAFLRLSGLTAVAAALAACGGTAAPSSSPAATSPAASGAPSAPAKPATSTPAGVAASPAASTGSSAAAKPAASGAAGGKVQLPTYIPSAAIKPDFPSSEGGLVDPGFLNYPADPPKSVTQTPANGGSMTVTTWNGSTGQPLPTPMDQNPMWQAVNKELGLTLNVNVVPFADYQQTRLTTMIASGELTDVVYISPGAVINELPAFLKAKAADLTPFLSGDNIKDYPNLANFPTLAWKNVVFNNAIYGVPAPYPPFLWVHWVHQEYLDQAGLGLPKSADDYKKALMAVTKANQNIWGIGCENTGGFTNLVGHFSGIFGAPNQWRNDNGKLTYMLETDQFRAAVSYTKELYVAGVFNPNSLTYDTQSKRNDFIAKRFVFDWDGFQQASLRFFDSNKGAANPSNFRVVPPFGADANTKPAYWSNTGIFGYSIIKQASADRIKEILRVMNYIAAPFGTHEHKLMRFGIEGVDHKPDDKGNPILTDKGKVDTAIPWPYMTQPPPNWFYPGSPDYPKLMQDAEKSIVPALTLDPTVGLYSNTYASKFSTLNRHSSDVINDIVKGGSPLSAMDQLVKDFKSGGGDQMRSEFEAALAAAS